MWEGQTDPRHNWNLGGRYRKALRDPDAMHKIIAEWQDDPLLAQHRITPP
jgi:hypothetical protein